MKRMHAVVVAIILLAALSFAETPWERVETLKPGQTLKVYLRNGDVLKGKVQTVTADGLSLIASGGKTAQLRREEVRRVTRKSRARGALWGGLILFGVSAPIGAYAGPYIADYGNPSATVRLRHAAGWGLFFGGIGAGIGALTGMETTVYR